MARTSQARVALAVALWCVAAAAGFWNAVKLQEYVSMKPFGQESSGDRTKKPKTMVEATALQPTANKPAFEAEAAQPFGAAALTSFIVALSLALVTTFGPRPPLAQVGAPSAVKDNTYKVVATADIEAPQLAAPSAENIRGREAPVVATATVQPEQEPKFVAATKAVASTVKADKEPKPVAAAKAAVSSVKTFVLDLTDAAADIPRSADLAKLDAEYAMAAAEATVYDAEAQASAKINDTQNRLMAKVMPHFERMQKDADAWKQDMNVSIAQSREAMQRVADNPKLAVQQAAVGAADMFQKNMPEKMRKSISGAEQSATTMKQQLEAMPANMPQNLQRWSSATRQAATDAQQQLAQGMASSENGMKKRFDAASTVAASAQKQIMASVEAGMKRQADAAEAVQQQAAFAFGRIMDELPEKTRANIEVAQVDANMQAGALGQALNNTVGNATEVIAKHTAAFAKGATATTSKLVDDVDVMRKKHPNEANFMAGAACAVGAQAVVAAAAKKKPQKAQLRELLLSS